MRIPSTYELRAGLASAAAIKLAQAEEMRRLVLTNLREQVGGITEFVTAAPGRPEEPLRGAIVDAIATGIEIGIHIGEARAAKQSAEGESAIERWRR